MGEKMGLGNLTKMDIRNMKVILLMINMKEKAHYMVFQVFIMDYGNLVKKMGMEKNYLMKKI
jgi:hypothetical protein